MKVLLSWLREFAPDIGGEPAALSDVLSALGLTVEEMTVTGAMPGGVVLGRVLDLRPPPRRRPDPARRRGRRLRLDPAGVLRGVQHGGRRPGAAGPGGDGDAQRAGDRPPQAARPGLRGHVLLGDRARHGRRRRRHHDPQRPGRARRRAGHTAGRGHRPGARRAVGPRRRRQPARRPVGDGRGPGPRGRPGCGLRASRLVDTRFGPRHLGGRRRGDHRSDAMRPFRRAGAAQRSAGLVAGVDGQPADRAGPASHQPHRRHLQLRDAGAGPAQPHLRPGPGERSPDPGAPGPRRRDDHHPRRPAPRPVRRRRRDRRWRRRGDRHRRGDGRGVHRDRRRHHRRAGGDGRGGTRRPYRAQPSG